MTNQKWYSLFFGVLSPFVRLAFPMKVTGRENLPEGAALICPLHSNIVDPILISYAFGRKTFLRHLAKAESIRTPVFGWIMRRIGSIFVRRGESDIAAYKQCVGVLKAGEKLLLFPEGTRVHGDGTVPTQTGVIHMAAAARAAIVPVYLPRDKKAFRRVEIIIGKPYYVNIKSHDDYARLADELMDTIWELGGGRP